MPSLADLYSMIDSAKRRAADTIANPGLSLAQMVNNANDRARALNEQTAAAAQEGVNYGPASRQLAQHMAESYNPTGMTVWHGSPYAFSKFDLGKIGTGEGAQAYGRGMYMAQNPEVAEGYKKTLSNDVFNVGGEIFDPMTLKHLNVKVLAKRGDLDAAIEKAKQISLSNSGASSLAAEDLKVLESLKKSGGFQKHEGNIYKVDLPDTHIRRMLDWDEPIKNQPKNVRNFAKQLGVDMNDLGGDLLAVVGKGEEGRLALQKAGIPGIKYLDQSSRSAKEGTRNFVVFDPNHLTILERNNQPIK